MRKLDQDELAFIGGFTILVLIITTPFIIIQEITQPYLDSWEEEILAEGECVDNLTECLVWLSVDLGRVVSIVFFLKPIFNLSEKLGMPNMPKRWAKYLGPKSKTNRT